MLGAAIENLAMYGSKKMRRSCMRMAALFESVMSPLPLANGIYDEWQMMGY
jgi:hypothetical protein